MKTENIIRMRQGGFTMIELIIAAVMTLIVTLCVGVVLVNSHRAYDVTYDKVYADVVTDGFVAKRLFDSVIRKSSGDDITFAQDGSWAEVEYYNSGGSSYLDRYAKFFTSGSELRVQYGTITSYGIKQTTRTDTICGNVASCIFKTSGNSAIMILNLNDQQKSNTVVSSAYMHN